MARLGRYLLKLFWGESLALFGVAAFLLFLIQCLRLFDIVSDKGQSLWTLAGQALLGMPGLGIVFLYVCLGIGLGRSLRAMQASSELGMVHTNKLVPALLRAIGIYLAGGAAVVLVLAHLIEPASVKSASDWASSIAADLVSRAMVPHKFTELVGGVSLIISARDSVGNISGFFADDRRSGDSHRTYFARTAIITQDPQGYVLRMRDGAVQYLTGDKRFSEVSFTRYDLPLDNLTGSSAIKDPLSVESSLDIVLRGDTSEAAQKALWRRTGEGLRVFAIGLIVAAFAIFPTGRRRRFEVPIELTVLGTAFIERAVTSYLPLGPGLLGVASGSVLLIVIAVLVLLVRLRVFRPVRFKLKAA